MATATISSDFGLRQFQQQLNYSNSNPSQSRGEIQQSPNSAEEVSSGSERSPSRATVNELSPIRVDPVSNQTFRGESTVFGNGFNNSELFGSFGTNSNLLPYSMNLHGMQQMGFFCIILNPYKLPPLGGSIAEDGSASSSTQSESRSPEELLSQFNLNQHGVMDLGLCFNQLPGFETKPDLNPMTMREPKPYKCPHCVKSFANNSYLSQHMRIHLGIKPFGPCQYCGKKFTQLSHLQQHIRTHTGEKPYKCKIPGCDKAFSQLSNLQSHSRCHQGDKPFKCNSCYKCFNDETSLLDHIPKHKESKHLKIHICNICGKSYTQSLYLDKHMTKHADRRGDFRISKPYYSNELNADGFDLNQQLNQFNQLQGFVTANSQTGGYPYGTSNSNSLMNSSLTSQLFQQFNRANVRGSATGVQERNGVSFNMITPLEKINSFNQSSSANTNNGTNGTFG